MMPKGWIVCCSRVVHMPMSESGNRPYTHPLPTPEQIGYVLKSTIRFEEPVGAGRMRPIATCLAGTHSRGHISSQTRAGAIRV